MEGFLNVIEKLSFWSGKLMSYLILPIVALTTYEVIIRRYIMNRPTAWTQEFSLFLFAAYFLIGGAYCLRVEGFVSMDMVYNHFKGRSILIADIIIFFSIIIFCGILIKYGSQWAWDATLSGERSGSFWNPIVWPVRWSVPIGAILVLLQGLHDFIKKIIDRSYEVETSDMEGMK